MIKIVNYKDINNKEHLLKFQDTIFIEFNEFLEELCNSHHHHYKKSALISYWLNDYKNYLNNEDSFKANQLVKYKRGTVVKANLGFNLGHEQGGLHYCIVLNKKDSIYQPLLNVIPLTSIKDPKKRLHYTNVNLSNELYKKLGSKLDIKLKLSKVYLLNAKSMIGVIKDLTRLLDIWDSDNPIEEIKDENFDKTKASKLIKEFNDLIIDGIWEDEPWNNEYINSLFREIINIPPDSVENIRELRDLIMQYHSVIDDLIEIVLRQRDNNRKLVAEIKRMKNGSIAHVDQITTISKMRIFSPKTTDDALYNVKLSNQSLTLIDNKIKKLFTY